MRSSRELILLATLAVMAGACRPAGGSATNEALSVAIDSIRAVLIYGFEQNQTMDVEFASAIPDSALRWAPTPEVRDFAEQLEHIAAGNVFIVSHALMERNPPDFGDTAVYLNEKDELAGSINTSYDWIVQTLREMPTDELAGPTELFGQQVPRWRVYLIALEHAYWTRGQLVPYFRIHGVDPPDYRWF